MVVTVGGRCDESLHLIPKAANADNDLDGSYSAGRCDESLHLIPKTANADNDLDGGYRAGVHLFPFRTEKLSPAPPMILR